jgi:hypothetical protein
MTFYAVIAASGTPHVFYTENGGKYQSKSTPGSRKITCAKYKNVKPQDLALKIPPVGMAFIQDRPSVRDF